MNYDWFVNITLFSFCIIDALYYKVKNEMIIMTIVFIMIYQILSYITNQSNMIDIFIPIGIFIVSQVVLIPLSYITTVSFGDIKLMGIIFTLLGVYDGLFTIFYGSCFSLFPLRKRIVDKIPMGLMFYIGYLIHSFLKEIHL